MFCAFCSPRSTTYRSVLCLYRLRVASTAVCTPSWRFPVPPPPPPQVPNFMYYMVQHDLARCAVLQCGKLFVDSPGFYGRSARRLETGNQPPSARSMHRLVYEFTERGRVTVADPSKEKTAYNHYIGKSYLLGGRACGGS